MVATLGRLRIKKNSRGVDKKRSMVYMYISARFVTVEL